MLPFWTERNYIYFGFHIFFCLLFIFWVSAAVFEFNEILRARVSGAIKFIYAALRVKWKHIFLQAFGPSNWIYAGISRFRSSGELKIETEIEM